MGENCIEKLLDYKPPRKIQIFIDTAKIEITKGTLENLLTKYSLSAPTVSIGTQKDIRRLKYYLDLSIPVETVRISSLSETQQELSKEAISLCRNKPEIELEIGDLLLDVAILDGCMWVLEGHTTADLQARVINVETLKLAHELDIPI